MSALAQIVDSINSGIRMVELGKIKIGGLGASRATTSGGNFRMPRKDDHFTVTTLNRNPTGDLIPDVKLMTQLMDEYGEDGKLRQLPIRVLSDDINDILQSSWVCYGGKKCFARSDGKTLEWLYDNNGQKLSPPRIEDWTPEMETRKSSRGGPLFKLHTVLNCVIAAEQSRFGGVYKFRTTSIISFKQLYASLLQVSQLTGGILTGMPLVLVLRPVQVAPEGKATTVHVVHVELRGAGLMELQAQAVKQMEWRIQNKRGLMAAQTEYKKLLLPPGQESDSEAAEIVEEFHAEQEPAAEAPGHFDVIDDAPGNVETDGALNLKNYFTHPTPPSGDVPAPDPTPAATTGAPSSPTTTAARPPKNTRPAPRKAEAPPAVQPAPSSPSALVCQCCSGSDLDGDKCLACGCIQKAEDVPPAAPVPRRNEDIAEEYSQIEIPELRRQLAAASVDTRKRAHIESAKAQIGVGFLPDATDEQVPKLAYRYKLAELESRK